MVALAPVGLEGVVQGLACAGLLVGLLAGLATAGVAEVVGIGKDAQEPHQAVQLTHPVLQDKTQIRYCQEVGQILQEAIQRTDRIEVLNTD